MIGAGSYFIRTGLTKGIEKRPFYNTLFLICNFTGSDIINEIYW